MAAALVTNSIITLIALHYPFSYIDVQTTKYNSPFFFTAVPVSKRTRKQVVCYLIASPHDSDHTLFP